ncbi:hypothetical protein Cassandra_0328 [Pseudomonas phage Cassandra]|nr:hypothetical protein Cassandra_0328 [Pseudomonas phage Cassandra]
MKTFLKMLAYCVLGTSIGIAISQWFVFVLEMRLGTALWYIVGLGPVLLVFCILGSFLHWLIHKHLEKK